MLHNSSLKMRNDWQMFLKRSRIRCCYLIMICGSMVLGVIVWGNSKHYDGLTESWKDVFYNPDTKYHSGNNSPRKQQEPDDIVSAQYVISYSLFGSDPRYTDGALANAKLCKQIYHGWTMRVYYDDSVPKKILNQLKEANVKLVSMTGSKINKKLWRFQAAEEVKRFCSRDIDSRLSSREKAAVDKWIKSGKHFHIMRDHPKHSKYPILGGMWCAKTIPNVIDLLIATTDQSFREETNFLKNVIWPMAQKSMLQHDSFSCDKWGGGLPFPVKRMGWEYVGSVYIEGQTHQIDEETLKENGIIQKCLKNKSTSISTITNLGDTNKCTCRIHSESDVSGTTGHVFLGERTYKFAMSLIEESLPQTLDTNSVPKCRRWGVVTTINAPTMSIYKAAKHSNLCLVIVADQKTPVEKYEALEKSTKTVVFLSVKKQASLQNLEVVSHIPWNHFGRKNVGYLYAIMHGATAIFDFDDDNELTSEIPWLPAENWLVTDNIQVFNPYPTFINLTDVAWPRGFPLTQIQNTSTWIKPTKFTQVSAKKIGVVQSLANHDPDMDAIWRLTRKLPMYFDDDIRLLLPPGTFSSYNAQATVHYALWGTFLPVSVHGRVSDIWRSYIMQRLMHDVGMSVGFVSPFVKQIRNVHNYQADFMSEEPLYEKTEALVKVLSQWKSHSISFERRFVELFIELYERDFIGVKDVHLARKWIRSLKQIKYEFPKFLQNQATAQEDGTTKSSADTIKINKVQQNSWLSVEKHCYKENNDWSLCAGDHLLYRPSSHEQLLSRPFMCLKEPFCWMQLDWQNTNPPKWSCPVEKSLRLYDMSFHDTVMASAATLLEKRLNKISSTNHEVFLCNYKNINAGATMNYHYTFKECPGKVVTKQIRDCKWGSGVMVKDADFRGVDALIFGFEASIWEEWMHFHKPLILALWHVADQCRCTKETSQQLFDHLRELALNSTLHHVIGANTLYHLEYMQHYTGLNPIYLPATLISAINGLTWSQKRNEFLINGYEVPPKHDKFKLVKPNHKGRYELSDLTEYAGVVIVPYSITNGKSVEQYAMNIPMFAPSVEFAKTMINDRTATYKPYCAGMTSSMHPPKHANSPYEFDPNVRIDFNGQGVEDDVKFWISFGEIYRWPCIKYYESWTHLYELLETADRQKMSACMKQANKWRNFEELQNWCWVTKYIQNNDL